MFVEHISLFLLLNDHVKLAVTNIIVIKNYNNLKCVEGEQRKLNMYHDHDREGTEYQQEPFLFANKQ